MKSFLSLPLASSHLTHAHKVPLLSLASVNQQLDHPYGMCWPRPLHDQAVLIPHLPIALVEKWSLSPQDAHAWGPAHAPKQCPDYANHGPCTWSGCRIRLYAHGVQHGSHFPPIAVIYRPHDPDPLYGSWLVDDGLHRISALKLLNRDFVSAYVASDTLETLLSALEISVLPPCPVYEVG